jgi:hypothetical protein
LARSRDHRRYRRRALAGEDRRGRPDSNVVDWGIRETIRPTVNSIALTPGATGVASTRRSPRDLGAGGIPDDHTATF